jgi:hypothetical protein
MKSKKLGGSHTTLIEAAEIAVRMVEKIPGVTKISPGFITAGLRSANGKLRIKITQFKGGLLLSIRGNTAEQEVRVYSQDSKRVMEDILKGAENMGYTMSHIPPMDSRSVLS